MRSAAGSNSLFPKSQKEKISANYIALGDCYALQLRMPVPFMQPADARGPWKQMCGYSYFNPKVPLPTTVPPILMSTRYVPTPSAPEFRL
jgi:hypothetical protein